ncbi:MAG: TIGR02594 family protein [Crocinitomix sp.]|nr:TIGR02594 family protein [Crocinitomix sp.]
MNKQIEAYIKAQSFIGTKEIRGPSHNQIVVDMFKDVGHAWVKDDETAWCAAFVGSMLEKVGVDSTRKLDARSYLGWGEVVEPEDAREGDVMVFYTGDKNGWRGHTGFLVSITSTGSYEILGGNQSDSVGINTYPKERLLGIRRIREVVPFKPMISSKELLAGSGALLASGAGVLGAVGPVPQIILSVGLTISLMAFGAFIIWNRVQARKRGER